MYGRSGFVVLVVLALLSAQAFGPSAFGEEEGPGIEAAGPHGFAVSRMVVCEGVKNREPVGAGEEFGTDVGEVYAFIEAVNIAEDTQVTFIWYHGGEEISRFGLPLRKGPRWRTFASKDIRRRPGDWNVELRDAEGARAGAVSFRVR